MLTARRSGALVVVVAGLLLLSACSAPQSPEDAFLERVREDTNADEISDEQLLTLGNAMCSLAQDLDGDELESALDAITSQVAEKSGAQVGADGAVLSVHALAHLCPEQGEKLRG